MAVLPRAVHHGNVESSTEGLCEHKETITESAMRMLTHPSTLECLLWTWRWAGLVRLVNCCVLELLRTWSVSTETTKTQLAK